MAWEPGQANSEETAPSLFRPPPWHDQVVSCLGSKQISPPRSELSGEAWQAALLDSQPVFPVIPQMEPLNVERRNQIYFLSFVNIRSTKLGWICWDNISSWKLGVTATIWPNISWKSNPSSKKNLDTGSSPCSPWKPQTLQHSWKWAIWRFVFHLQVRSSVFHTYWHITLWSSMWKLTILPDICWKCWIFVSNA